MEKESSRTYLLLLLGVSWILFLFPSPCDSRLDDMDVLVKMKSSLIGTNGSGLYDWEPSPAPAAHCSFSGVICDGVARVVSLNLSFFALGGRIPPEIGFLDRLVNLTLAASNLTGALPVEMKNLTNLRVLNISNNVLSGGGFFGEILTSMPELEILDAYNNDFMGRLPAELSEMKKLKHLSLGGNFFTGEIPESYAEIQSLEYLGLNGIGLTGKTPSFLARLKNLREMYIGYYNAFVGGIPPEFDGLTELRVLDMGSCNLTGEIPARLGNLKNLHSLFLQINNLTGNIPPELSNLVSLKSLDLSINQLTGEIPQSFSALKKITLINLFKNNLYGRIPSCVGDLPNLEVFQVWGNNFTFELPENLGRNGRLKSLDVSVNHLTGLVPPDLCRGGRLQTLILMDNFFFGTIPEDIGRCKSLTRIRMMKNLMNGTVPPGIFSLPLLTMIELNDNFFSGELPVKMYGGALSQIYLSNNWFTGEVPHAIGNFSNLQILSLEGNRFRGRIPQEIFDLTRLTMINISDNNLTGAIPPTISRCASLISIDLSRNNLTGEIPRGIDNLTNLGTLNVSKNQLTGQIPSEIRSMTSLTTLDLSFNDLSGRVPIGGEFLAFNDTSFAGNPYLCLSHRLNCPRRRDKSSSHSHTASFSTSTLIIIIIILIAIAGVTLTISTVYGIHRKRNQRLRAWKLTAFQRLEFTAEDVLNCLKEENIIGKGGAGIVYRGSMPSGVDVAIKRLTGRGDRGFTAEIKTLGGIRHRNIVRLLGYVSNNHDANLLLYEYMPNGSLGEVLHGPKGGYLRWEARYRIAVEAAKGLCYLHHDCSPLIVHRDVKSNNILLGSGFEAHVADFGLARFLEQDGAASECMSAVAGSYGYIAPEYAYTLKVDEKSDVYSFGVVLLEMIAGKKPVGDFGDGVDIVRWVMMKIESEASHPPDAASMPAIMDSRLTATTGDPAPDYVEHMFKLAMMCVESEASARPTMRAVVQMLVAAAATDGC